MTHAAIIGNGIAGISAARRLRVRQPDWTITVISGESTHHYSRPALMYIFMGHMKYRDTKPYHDGFWRRERIDLVRDWVVNIDTANARLDLHRGGSMPYDHLLLAVGSKSNRFGWPGQDLEGVQGLYDLMDLHRLYQNVRGARHAVIVGGGLIGIEMAEMLHTRNIHVTFLVREKSYWNNVLPDAESAMVNRYIEREGFDLRLNTELSEILDDGRGRARAVVTNHGEELPAEIVGLTAGVSPNLDLVRDTDIATGRGILTDWSLRTNVPGIIAAGDCAEIVRDGEARNLLQQVWYTGRMQGEVAAASMAEEQITYDPGIWYNSAKFLDLEYQTYGTVLPNPPDGETQLWWESADGRHGMRLAHAADGAFTGVNIMGMRYRHRVFEQWIDEQRSIDDVIGRLGEANFDTEFVCRYEDRMIATFREQMR